MPQVASDIHAETILGLISEMFIRMPRNPRILWCNSSKTVLEWFLWTTTSPLKSIRGAQRTYRAWMCLAMHQLPSLNANSSFVIHLMNISGDGQDVSPAEMARRDAIRFLSGQYQPERQTQVAMDTLLGAFVSVGLPESPRT
ncbi:hypothetical protein K458DRAFT_383016 [Lentithecium fluviatile CBS 122367]|uniref:Uncharacterized protein n=1 Tax=Lentithecium fluviatile CBS 122367 TaxID=1168545 RepID=A0A6G1JH69_9PLEO|nr:hypothetical protein K458DRAFT_383016 [Lentithecium fluviatile CBS 122367]